MESTFVDAEERLLYEGRHLSLKQTGSWEYVERRFRAGGVLVVAVTSAGELLLVEEDRPPVRARVISLPAGLVGDGGEDEDPGVAAARELCEETGYEATSFELLGEGPSSPGLASESVAFFRARDVRRKDGVVAEEGITLHRVPVAQVRDWARERASGGARIHPLLWAGLYLARL